MTHQAKVKDSKGIHASSTRARQRVGILIFLWVATFWRWSLWARFPLREDEALYGHWAWLIYSGIDPLLRGAPVDKPPLFPYLVAHVYTWLTPSPEALRLPGEVASLLTLPLLYAWLRALFNGRVARAGGFLYGIFPLAVLLAPTGYTDPLMVGWAVLAGWAASRARCTPLLWGGLSGAAWAAAVATKPMAVLWLPLVWGTLWARRAPRWAWIAWGLGATGPLLRWWAWEQVHGPPFTWQLGWLHYGGFHLLPPSAWLERGVKWLRVWWDTWGGVGGVLVLGLAGLGGWLGCARRHRGACLLAGWLGGVLLLYGMTSLAPWDRYLLLLAPATVGLAAYGWDEGWSRRGRIPTLLLILLLGWGLWVGCRAGRGQYPVGGDHGAYEGIDAVASYIMADLPRGGIVYHHWLGWHYGFYLFAAPYDFRWWPDVQWLVRDVERGPRVPRVLVFPAWHERERLAVVNALRGRGIVPTRVRRVYTHDGHLRFWVYLLSPWDARSRRTPPQLP